MTPIMLRLICLAIILIGYCFGLIQTAVIISKAFHVDIRHKGSGNAGTTNMFRVMGIKAGIFTFVGDMLKALIAITVTYLIFIDLLGLDIDKTALILYTGLGCILGHNFPFYLKFKGGKGIATSSAVFLALLDLRIIIVGIVVFAAVLLITRYVSLSSMCTMTAVFITFLVISLTGLYEIEPAWRPDCYILFVIIVFLAIWRHKTNIHKLLKHTESRFAFRTSKQIKKDEENGR